MLKEINQQSIVFLHGLSSSSRVYTDTIKDSTLRYNKIALDLPGHGNYQNFPDYMSHYNRTACRTYVLEEIQKINSPVILIGNSIGGHIAIDIAEHIPKLKALVIFGTAPLKTPLNFEEAFIQIPELQTYMTKDPSDKDIKDAIHAVLVNKLYSDVLYEDFKSSNPLVREALLNDIQNGVLFNEHKKFKELEIPKYIIIPENDISINTKYLEQLSEESTTFCKTVKIANCGHYPSLEQSIVFNQILKQICKEVF